MAYGIFVCFVEGALAANVTSLSFLFGSLSPYETYAEFQLSPSPGSET
jgi:hypothetical protein